MCESLKGLLGLGLEEFGHGGCYGFNIDHLGFDSNIPLWHGHAWESLLAHVED